MKIFNLIAVGLTMLFAANSVPSNADDVIVRHRTKDGKPERLVVDHTQLQDVQKAMRQSKSLDRFQTSTETKVASMLKSPLRDPAGSQGPEETEEFAVRFAVEDEAAPEGLIYEPMKVYVCKGDGEYGRAYYNYSWYPDEDIIAQGYTWGCFVPKGEYTIILCSQIYSVDENGDKQDLITHLYVVKENVNIDGETKITFRQSEAKNLITASCILPDGTEAPGDPFIYDENGTCIGQREDLWVNAYRSFVNINGDYSLDLGNYDGPLDYVFINDISSNWVYVINMQVVDENGAYTNCITHPGPITSNLHIQNNPADYKLTTVRFNSLMPGVNADVKGFGVATKIVWKGADQDMATEGIVLNGLGISDDLPLYINAAPSDLSSPTAFDLITIPIVATDKIEILALDWDGNPILDENGDKIYFYDYPTITGPGIYQETDNRYICCDSYGYDVDEYPLESFLLPYDKEFSFEKLSNTEFFSEAPVLSVFTDNFISESYSRFDVWPTFYYTCLASYTLPYKFSAKYNGTLFVEDETTYTFNFEEWSFENYKEPGEFDIEVSAAWKNEDHKAIVGNTFHIDTRNDDYFVPQVVRWQLRDQDGSIGDMATSTSKIYLMCQEDVDTDFSISASIPEIDYYDLNVKMIRDELFYEYYEWLIRRVYEISLEDFPGIKGDKYSLEFNLSDASGNTSKQTIGNAFEWGTATGINVIDNDKEIYFENGILYAPTNAEVFTIDGHRANRNALTSGLYLVKIENKTTKVLVP